ncbi:MAG TPA: hypothetical protein VJ960_01375, partial [Oceanipulchritudo sp.]|nr:hypothetical protein [Oceanipulchritudo sp.]
QVRPFCEGLPIHGETASRGRRGAYLNAACIVLEPGQEVSWYTCADVAKDAAEIESLRAEILSSRNLPGRIEADCEETELRLKEMLSGADGFQCTGLPRETLRHTSNTVFNLMRGGALVTGYVLPKEDLLKTVAHFNRAAADSLATLIDEEGLTLTCGDSWDHGHPLAKGNPDALRLVREYLPLSFSRRHGDPSRPWNRFDIVIREADGSPRFAYQGNWRDIFQNWEASYTHGLNTLRQPSAAFSMPPQPTATIPIASPRKGMNGRPSTPTTPGPTLAIGVITRLFTSSAFSKPRLVSIRGNCRIFSPRTPLSTRKFPTGFAATGRSSITRAKPLIMMKLGRPASLKGSKKRVPTGN